MTTPTSIHPRRALRTTDAARIWSLAQPPAQDALARSRRSARRWAGIHPPIPIANCL